MLSVVHSRTYRSAVDYRNCWLQKLLI